MKTRMAIACICLAIYAIAAFPDVTGILVHEWVSVALCVALLAHLFVHIDWLDDAITRKSRRRTWVTWGNLALDAASGIVFAVVVVSGLAVSGYVLPLFGLYCDGYFFWSPLHAISAKVFLALVIVHMVGHARQVVFWLDRQKRDEAKHSIGEFEE